jgi:predicted anti-sigma-YlaC factor YlaD
MRYIDTSVSCSRVRAQVSLRLDGELSEIESRMLSAHLGRCDGCRLYAEDVEEFTSRLRAAEPLALTRPILVRRPRRLALARMQAGVAAVLALVSLGLASQLAPSSTGETSLRSTTVTRYPSSTESEYELALLNRLPDRSPQSVNGSPLL